MGLVTLGVKRSTPLWLLCHQSLVGGWEAKTVRFKACSALLAGAPHQRMRSEESPTKTPDTWPHSMSRALRGLYVGHCTLMATLVPSECRCGGAWGSRMALRALSLSTTHPSPASIAPHHPASPSSPERPGDSSAPVPVFFVVQFLLLCLYSSFSSTEISWEESQ